VCVCVLVSNMRGDVPRTRDLKSLVRFVHAAHSSAVAVVVVLFSQQRQFDKVLSAA
jgi:hypothetical protein